MILVGAAGAAAPDDHPSLDPPLTWITLTNCGALDAPPDDHPLEPPDERPSILMILTILGDDDAECDDPPELPPKLKKLA